MPYNIKGMRIKKKLSQTELSHKSHVSRAIISQLEQANAEVNTTTDTLIKIANALNCKICDIFSP